MVDVSSPYIQNRSLEENDRSAIVQLVKWLLLGGILLSLLFASVSIRKEIDQLSREMEKLSRENEHLAGTNDQLRAEYNSITSPQELERLSKKLGLISSNHFNVLILDVQNLETARTQMAWSETEPGILRE